LKFKTYIKTIGLLFCFALLFTLVNAQEDNEQNSTYKEFNKEDYNKATEGVDYTEDILKRKEKEPNDLDFNPPDWNFGDWSIVAELLKFLGIGGVVLLLAYLVFRLIDENYGSKKIINIQDHEIFENLEQHIHELDLNDLLNKALQQGNYKLAVRIHYLILIKKMSNAQLINWKKQKTNGEYLSEMYGNSLFENFRKSTNLFERVWYGDVEINKDKYHIVQQTFDVLLNKIPNSSDETK